MYSWHFNLNFRFTTVCCVDQAGLEYRILLSHMTSGYYSYRHYTHTKVLTLTKTLCVQYLIQGFIHAKQTLLNTYIPKLLCTTGPKQQINITELLKKKCMLQIVQLRTVYFWFTLHRFQPSAVLAQCNMSIQGSLESWRTLNILSYQCQEEKCKCT